MSKVKDDLNPTYVSFVYAVAEQLVNAKSEDRMDILNDTLLLTKDWLPKNSIYIGALNELINIIGYSDLFGIEKVMHKKAVTDCNSLANIAFFRAVNILKRKQAWN